MVALTGVTVAMVATAGAAGPAIVAGVSAGANIGAGVGAATGLGGAVTAAATGSAVAAGTTVIGAAAAGGAAGAIGGSVAAGSGAAAALGAAGGAASGAAGGAAISSICAGIFTGPVGWVILGTTAEESSGVYTFDCWKPILHDDSSEPSHGKTLREIAMDPRIKQVSTTANENNANFPHLVLQNVWDEQFRIDYVYLFSNQLAAHAVKI